MRSIGNVLIKLWALSLIPQNCKLLIIIIINMSWFMELNAFLRSIKIPIAKFII